MDHTMNKPPTDVKHLVQFGFHFVNESVTLWIRRTFWLQYEEISSYSLRAPSWARTSDLQISIPTLYPAELPEHDEEKSGGVAIPRRSPIQN